MELEQAFEVIERGRAAAAGMGIGAAIAVVDSGGHLVAFARMDGTAFMTVEIAHSKAWTAASVGIPTALLGQVLGGEAAFLASSAAVTHGRFIAAAGGYPVKDGDQVLGGVGVSGGSSDQDEAVAEAAAG